MKNRVSGLLLETGVGHNKERLHQVKYFQELLTDKEVTESIRPLLTLSHETIRRLDKTETPESMFETAHPMCVIKRNKLRLFHAICATETPIISNVVESGIVTNGAPWSDSNSALTFRPPSRKWFCRLHAGSRPDVFTDPALCG
jgi:hypothetical protein